MSLAKKPNPILEKIRASSAKKRGPARARAGEIEVLPTVKELKQSLREKLGRLEPKMLARLEENLDAMKETYDPKAREWRWVPDNALRQKALMDGLAYLHGKPPEFTVQVNASIEDLGALMDRMQESPATAKALAALRPMIQQTGSESGADSPS